jgi:hypothetical protein
MLGYSAFWNLFEKKNRAGCMYILKYTWGNKKCVQIIGWKA